MAYKHEREIDMNEVAAFLSDAVSKVKTEEDVDVLNQLKKVFKKNVPFSLRTYVAAYFAKELMSGRGRFHSRRSNRFEDRSRHEEHHSFEKNSDFPVEERIHHERVQIPEESAATIFISIGRNRRVYPRDLIGLLINAGGVERERIGDIRVLASYSFVQLYKEDADKVIATLNGYDYRGRKLSVSYSQKKDEDEAEAQE